MTTRTTPATVRIGDRVKLYGKRYVRGTRRPGYNGRFTRHFIGYGTLLAKADPAAHEPGTATHGWSREALEAHFTTHLGLRNATGNATAGDLTEKNNPVKLDNGRVIWADAECVCPA